MSRQYSLRNFLRRAPQALLRDYLAQQGLGNDIDWKYLTPNNVEPVFSVIREADAAAQERTNLAFQEIHDMADESGILTIIQEAKDCGDEIDLAEALKEMSCCYEKAFWVFLNHPTIFSTARIIDIPNDRRTTKRGGFPPLTYEPDDAAKDKLGRALSEFYLKKDGRGQGYKVDYYRRGDKHLYYAYLEGFAHSNLVYDENHELRNDIYRPAFEIIFRYNSAERTLEISGASGKRIINELQMIFSETILKHHIETPPDVVVFDLTSLRDRDVDLSPAPDLGIRSTRVKKLKVSLWGRQGINVTIDVGSNYGLSDIHDIIDAILESQRLPSDMLEIKQAGFQLGFEPEPGKKKGRPRSFSVSHPEATSLKDGVAHDEKARKCLKKWKIDVSGTAEGCAAEPPLAAQSLLDY